jgi:polyisoprenoid-binding protein YceI
MKLALLLALLPLTALADRVSYELDPEHTFVHFEVLHFDTSTLRGRFGPVTGEVQIDRAAGSGALSLRIATAGVSTGLAVLDSRLRRDDLLATEAFPEAYFVATRFRFAGDTLAEVRGEFTLRGMSQPLSLTAVRYGCRREGATGEVCGGDFEAEIKRSEFGASFGLPFVGDRVRLHIQAEGRRREAPAASPPLR